MIASIVEAAAHAPPCRRVLTSMIRAMTTSDAFVAPVRAARPRPSPCSSGWSSLSNRLAFLLRFDGDLPPVGAEAFWADAAVAGRRSVPLTFVPFRLYEGLWRYTSLYDLRSDRRRRRRQLASLFSVVDAEPARPAGLSAVDLRRRRAAADAAARRHPAEPARIYAELSAGRHGKRVLIYGAGDAGELIVRDMKTNRDYGYQPIGFVDDDPREGRPAHPRRAGARHARRTCRRSSQRYRPDEVLIAIPQRRPGGDPRRSSARSSRSRCRSRRCRTCATSSTARSRSTQIRNLSIEDLLARAPVGLDPAPLQHLIAAARAW